MPYQQLQFWVESEDLSQLGDRFGRIQAAAEIPGSFDRTAEQLVRSVRLPIELARGEIDRGAGQRRDQRLSGWIVEMIEAGVRIGIEAGDRSIVASPHFAVAPVQLAAKLGNIEAPCQPAADGLVEPRQCRHLVGKTRRG